MKTNGNPNGSLAKEPLRHKITLVLVCFGMAVLGGWLGAMAMDRDPPVVTYSMKPLTPEVVAGDTFRIEYTMHRRRNCKTHIDRFLFDGQNQRHVLPDLEFRNLPLGEDTYTVPVAIPEKAAPGKSIYRVISTYSCNPVQDLFEIKGPARDIQFVILPRVPKPDAN